MEPRNDVQLGGTYFADPADLATAVLDQIYDDNHEALHELRIDRKEIAEIFWPEFPMSRPVTSITAHDAWQFHDADCRDGVNDSLTRWTGWPLKLVDVECTVGRAEYTNFTL